VIDKDILKKINLISSQKSRNVKDKLTELIEKCGELSSEISQDEKASKSEPFDVDKLIDVTIAYLDLYSDLMNTHNISDDDINTRTNKRILKLAQESNDEYMKHYIANKIKNKDLLANELMINVEMYDFVCDNKYSYDIIEKMVNHSVYRLDKTVGVYMRDRNHSDELIIGTINYVAPSEVPNQFVLILRIDDDNRKWFDDNRKWFKNVLKVEDIYLDEISTYYNRISIKYI
jgi:hypothetical protein